MKYIDTHCHLNFKAFKEDADKLILNSLNSGVGMIVVGSNYKSSKKAIDLANRYEDGVWAAAGLHPVHLEDETEMDNNGRLIVKGRAEDFNYESYEGLAGMEKTVAIGEIGLDYYHLKLTEDIVSKKNKQKDIFAKQLLLARKSGLAAIIHCRNAHGDLYDTLNDFRHNNRELMPEDKSPWGVIHCFSGDESSAWDYFDMGLMISFTGIITFSKKWDDLIRKAPIDKIMIETDSPFMTPEPYRGKKNDPSLVPLVAERIAKIRGEEPEDIAAATTENAKRLFKI